MRYSWLIIGMCFLAQAGIPATPAVAEELLRQPVRIVAQRDGKIPQAARVSPDGRRLVFEYYGKDWTTLWIADTDGGNAACLTCANPPQGETLTNSQFENGYWHPSGDFLVFNRLLEQREELYVGAVAGDHFSNVVYVDRGSRPQFSKPNGNVVFFQQGNQLSYRILGPDPLNPYRSLNVDLRGPIAKVNAEVKVSHPSLAPDGTTILFAARLGNISKIDVNDIERQRLYSIWQALRKVPLEKINGELKVFEKYFAEGSPTDWHRDEIKEITVATSPEKFAGQAFDHVLAQAALMKEAVLVKGCTRRDLLLLWTLGFLNKLGPSFESEVQQQIYSRIWVTDVFGAPIEPLVKDLSSAPLPQKWPTVAKDGSFAVFEAGHWANRHIYLIAKKNGQWLERAIKITEKGSYNSSPEIDPTGQWLYFESNRDGSKGIWRATLDWPIINKQLGL